MEQRENKLRCHHIRIHQMQKNYLGFTKCRDKMCSFSQLLPEKKIKNLSHNVH